MFNKVQNNHKLLKSLLFICLFISIGFSYSCKDKEDVNNAGTDNTSVEFWLTDPGKNVLFSHQESIAPTSATNGIEMITIDPALTYQEMDGFGFALTGGSAYHLFNMSAAARKQLLTELFGTDGSNIGTSYLRVSIGASDLDAEVFSYDDMPAGQTDLTLRYFSLGRDYDYLIPVLKEILEINPDIKIMGSPWSAPVWMKTNGSSIGGSLKTEYYSVYAQYFVKYIQAMKEVGITIDAVTVQNEPLHDGNNPSMYMPAAAQAAFIKNNLGPAFQAAGIQTKIIIYDHNADRVDYPLTVLNDAGARQYIDGSAFHLYGGDIDDLSQLHQVYPDKNIYFTEQWVGQGSTLANNLKWHVTELIVGATRNWCKTVIEWNLAANENLEPHTPGGCSQCVGAVTITGDAVTRNSAYYIIAHASKFVRPGSKRIESTASETLPNTAFTTPSGKKAVIVMNNTGSEKYFNMKMGEKVILCKLSAGAAGTYIW
jgi:glucosylceramidase